MNTMRKVLILGATLALTHCKPPPNTLPAVEFTDTETLEFLKLSPLPPPPPSLTNAVADNPDAADFGQMMFFNMDLSINGEVSCATCHKPELGFSDGKSVSKGISEGTRNAPTLWNTAYQQWFFWDGRADSLWAQGAHPFLNKKEMGTSPEILRLMVNNHPDLRTAYEKVYGTVPSKESYTKQALERFLSNLGKSLEAYQRKLITSNAPFDRWVAVPKTEAISVNPSKATDHLTPSALRGLKLFVGSGKCTQCHSGPNFSDGEFHNLGLQPIPDAERDYGRYKGIADVKTDTFNGLGEFSDNRSIEANIRLRYVGKKLVNLGEFKTPTLRNIAASAPYMHDGRFATLREVIDFYSKLPGLPVYGHREETLEALELTGLEIEHMEAFPHTLKDESLDKKLLQPFIPDY